MKKLILLMVVIACASSYAVGQTASGKLSTDYADYLIGVICGWDLAEAIQTPILRSNHDASIRNRR